MVEIASVMDNPEGNPLIHRTKTRGKTLLKPDRKLLAVRRGNARAPEVGCEGYTEFGGTHGSRRDHKSWEKPMVGFICPGSHA